MACSTKTSAKPFCVNLWNPHPLKEVKIIKKKISTPYLKNMMMTKMGSSRNPKWPSSSSRPSETQSYRGSKSKQQSKGWEQRPTASRIFWANLRRISKRIWTSSGKNATPMAVGCSIKFNAEISWMKHKGTLTKKRLYITIGNNLMLALIHMMLTLIS